MFSFSQCAKFVPRLDSDDELFFGLFIRFSERESRLVRVRSTLRPVILLAFFEYVRPRVSRRLYTPKLEPQPQLLAAFGLSNVNPRAFRPSW